MIYVTVSTYALGRALGLEAAAAEFNKQVVEPTTDSLPAARTVYKLAQLAFEAKEAIGLRVDSGATCIGKARSRAFYAALDSGAEVWVTVDDDVEATAPTLKAMLEAVEPRDEPAICIVPCLLRRNEEAQPTVNVDLPRVAVERELPRTRAKVRRCFSGGFGLVAMNRSAMHAVAVEGERGLLNFVDDDGVKKLALFLDMLSIDGEQRTRWIGEDLSFFRRVPPSVRVEALVDGYTSHAGYALNLSRLKGP